jgi:aldehyde dehydrogenase (NAD+)
MELGGKSANIVFADADLDSALELAWFSIFYNKGEICTAGSRMLVERSIHDEFVERFAARASATIPGNPSTPQLRLGRWPTRTVQEGRRIRAVRPGRRGASSRGR